MYLCMCSAVSEKQMIQLVASLEHERGSLPLEELQRIAKAELGVGAGCGACNDYIAQWLIGRKE